MASAVTSANSTTLQGALNSKPDKTYNVRFFSSPSSEGEGKTFRGQKTVTTNANGDATFSFSPASKVDAGLMMTATDSEGNASEFSAARTVTAQ